MPDTCGHQCSQLRQGLCVGCSELDKQMKITFSYYPRGQPAVHLTINYVPKLDEYKLTFGGFLDTETNTAFVDWPTLKIFKDGEISDKKTAFANLKPIAEQENYLQLKHF